MAQGLIRTGFAEDLKLGQEIEGEFAKVLLAVGDSVEVKSDKRAHQTGNIYVELTYKGNPSGINASKAEWWVYEISGRFIVMKREDLLLLVERAIAEKRTRRGGDFNMTTGALVPVEWLVHRERLS